ncbi:MAG: hypothetical protein ACKV2T_41160 [Kofleriaceae bacterium]
MKTVSLALIFAALAAPRPASASTCSSIHAAKIAIDSGLTDCTTKTIKPFNQRASSGAELGAASSTCIGLTADACAKHFLDHPSHGLVQNARTAGVYSAYHFGANQGLRLPDGTRPMLYYKPAPGTLDSNPHFNKWLFFFYGGAGMCAQDIVQREGTGNAGTSSLTSQGAECLAKLAYGNQRETQAGTGFSRERYADFSTNGILGDDPENAVFSQYNRVVITKTNDFYIGDVTKTGVDVGGGFTVATMQLQGNAIVKQAMAFFTTPVQNGADFNDAQKILFVSSSSGTNNVHRVDEWRMFAMSLAPSAYVALMANSSGVTPDSFTLEEFDEAPCGSIYSGNCGATFDNPPIGITPTNGIRTDDGHRLVFSHAAFLDYATTYWDGTSDGQVAPGGEAAGLASVSAMTNSVLDASCLGTEIPPNHWKCRSPLYVMFNHLRTPLFIAHSLHDSSNIGGVIKGIASRDGAGNLPRWSSVRWPVGPMNGQEPMATLARFQFSSWVTDRNDGGGGAAGESRYAGPVGVWAPLCNHHEPQKSDLTFLSGRITIGAPDDNTQDQVTLEDTLVKWFEGGTTAVRIDGFLDSRTVLDGDVSACQ